MELQIKADLTQTLCVRQMHELVEIDIREGKKFNCLFINKEQAKQVISKLQECVGETSNENAALPIFDVSKSYCGEQGEDNMKADIKEIIHACGDKFDFIRLCNQAQRELDEAAFDLDQESRMNGV